MFIITFNLDEIDTSSYSHTVVTDSDKWHMETYSLSAEIYGGRKQLQIHSKIDRDEESLGPVKGIRVREKIGDIHYSKYVKRENSNFTYLK